MEPEQHVAPHPEEGLQPGGDRAKENAEIEAAKVEYIHIYIYICIYGEISYVMGIFIQEYHGNSKIEYMLCIYPRDPIPL